MSTPTIAELEIQLNDFDLKTRTAALDELLKRAETDDSLTAAPRDTANMHAHTFYSFNGYGYSPTALAWLAKKNGIGYLGSVDFDVLDAVDEFLAACTKSGIRASSGIETRVFLPDYADKVINSPGEPGVTYHMGIGFVASAVPENAEPVADDLRQRAQQRNIGLIERINPHLEPVALDYEKDVLPLTPGGTPTERHIVIAYLKAAEQKVDDVAAFWADKLGVERADVDKVVDNPPKLQGLVRSKLMKRGGVGYVQPGPDTFPNIEAFHQLIASCEALPCAAWLDGTTEGESDMRALLELLVDKGVVALNIVPDRNWNIADAEKKQVKVQNLYDVVKLAAELDLPLNIGTEMNAHGQKIVDDFDTPELEPVRQAFMDGAAFIYGHTVLQMRHGMGYQSAWALKHLPGRGERNRFYTQVGRKVEPGAALPDFDAETTPDQILSRL